MNIKVFFKKPENEPNVTYNHYGITDIKRVGNVITLLKGGEEVAVLNWDNVNQIVNI